MKKHTNPHDQAVFEFYKSCQERDPNQFEKVCDKYPTISARQWRRIRERELPYSEADNEKLYGADAVDDE